jgi:hypothetical protein
LPRGFEELVERQSLEVLAPGEHLALEKLVLRFGVAAGPVTGAEALTAFWDAAAGATLRVDVGAGVDHGSSGKRKGPAGEAEPFSLYRSRISGWRGVAASFVGLEVV